MGMDVYGKKPKSTRGEYFRNNVWWWHPLWDYCCFIDDQLSEKVPHGHYNSGDGLDAINSRQLGMLLQQSIESGVAKGYVEEFNRQKAQAPDQTCWCILYGSVAEEKDGNSTNHSDPNPECNICHGSGIQESRTRSYYIDVENIRDFSVFCIDSGGFEIC